MGLTTPLTAPLRAVAGYGAHYAWPGLVSVSRSTILSLLQRIAIGRLEITDTDGTVTICGQPDLKPTPHPYRSVYTPPSSELVVQKDVFWVRLLLFADMVRSSTLWTIEYCADDSRASQKATC